MLSRLFLPLLGVLWCVAVVRAQTDQTAYDDALQNGWVSYGWATLNYANTGTVTARSATRSA